MSKCRLYINFAFFKGMIKKQMGNESFSMNRVAKLEDNIQYDDQNENLTWVDRCYNELLVFKNRKKKTHQICIGFNTP